MRSTLVVPDTILSAILLTFACGLGASVLFFAWTRDRFDDATARTALLVLLLYPYAWFIFGAVYGDALFLVAAIGAFVLFERGHPVLAGLAGAVATATRPVGLAVVVGLVVLTIARRGGLRNWRALRPADAGVLLSFAGLGAWCSTCGRDSATRCCSRRSRVRRGGIRVRGRARGSR